MMIHFGYALQVGDIPDFEAKPPDNVLFVCKLNPVTEVSTYTLLLSGGVLGSICTLTLPI